MDQVDSEEVVNRFALPLEEYDIDETEEIKPFGANAEQQHEYRLAFAIVSRGKESITAAQINDVYVALGYTLQVSDLETIVDNCVPDDSGRYPCENTLEAYDLFKRDMMDERCARVSSLSLRAIAASFLVDRRLLLPSPPPPPSLPRRYLAAVFAMLATKKRVSSKFPVEYVRTGLSERDQEKMKVTAPGSDNDRHTERCRSSHTASSALWHVCVCVFVSGGLGGVESRAGNGGLQRSQLERHHG
jgi:hypothetical protein